MPHLWPGLPEAEIFDKERPSCIPNFQYATACSQNQNPMPPIQWCRRTRSGLQQAKRLVLLADMIGAEEALRLGLVTWVKPAAELDEFGTRGRIGSHRARVV